ncbi:MAG TPA: cytochrome c [Candidatus Solibacter sp.]|nr:cytochrome c [Candidatus Solibacter sp.]
MFSANATILFGAALVTFVNIGAMQGKKEQKPLTMESHVVSGKGMFTKYCASCHGQDAKGSGPAAIAMKTPPPDLTTLSKRNDGKYPEGYVGAVLKFGRSMASHSSEDMPVWGSRFKTLDPAGDPTGQQHVDALVAYIKQLQVK